MAEYLSLLVQSDPHAIERIVSLPPDLAEGRDKREIAKDTDLWIYEHLRRLPLDLTPLLTSLLPVCTRSTCPEMRAGEWQYICVAHEGRAGEDCCAIDYILHTVDSMTATLVSPNSFPSRLSIKPGSEKLFGQLARRISRVFGHAYFHHREIFEESEAETALYARFVALAKKYNLMSMNLLVIPEKATYPSSSDDNDEERDISRETEGPSTSKKILEEADGRGMRGQWRGKKDVRGGGIGNGRDGVRGRGRGRGGKGRTLFAVDIEKDPEAEAEEAAEDETEEEEDENAKANGDLENGEPDVSLSKAMEVEEKKVEKEKEMDLPSLRAKESIESMVFMGEEGDD